MGSFRGVARANVANSATLIAPVAMAALHGTSVASFAGMSSGSTLARKIAALLASACAIIAGMTLPERAVIQPISRPSANAVGARAKPWIRPNPAAVRSMAGQGPSRVSSARCR